MNPFDRKPVQEVLDEELGHKVRQMFTALKAGQINPAFGFAGEAALLSGGTGIDRAIVFSMAREIRDVQEGKF